MKFGKASFIIFMLTSATSVTIGEDCADTLNNRYYWSPGDVYVTGLFNVHKGLNCSATELTGLRQTTNLILITEMLNNARYIPDLSIGVVLYDLCAIRNSANIALVSSVLDKECKPSYNLGIVTNRGVYDELKYLSTTLNVPVLELVPGTDINLFFKICIHLLMELRSTTIDLLLMPTVHLSNQFVELATEEGICLKQSLQSWPFDNLCLDNGKSVIVLIGQSLEIRSLILKINSNCTNRFVIGFLDNDVDLEKFFEGDVQQSSDVYIVASSNAWLDPEITTEQEMSAGSLKLFQDNSQLANVTLDFLQLASAVLSITDAFNDSTSKCYANGTSPLACPPNRLLMMMTDGGVPQIPILDADRISEITRALKLDERSVLSYVVLKYEPNGVLCFAETKLTNGDWILEFNFGVGKNLNERPTLCDFKDVSSSSTNFFDDDDYSGKSPCAGCSNNKLLRLQQFATIGGGANISSFWWKNFGLPLVWKTDIWVPAVMTVVVIGTITCLCVLVFIVMRICKGDVLEGNACTTILLVVSVLSMYLIVLPYCLRTTNNNAGSGDASTSIYRSLHCAVRLIGPQFSYNWVFALMLSRAVMILTCDYDGSFMSHINGYLHCFLCFFMVAVQAALVGQFVAVNWLLSIKEDFCERFTSSSGGNLFLFTQAYNGFLLLCLICTAPFIVHSKRNYKESVCFALTGLFILPVWCGWCCLYFFTNSTVWKDFSVAVGLSAVASVVVVCVFIPRSYLLMNGVIRDQIASALPSIHCSKPSVIATAVAARNINNNNNSNNVNGRVRGLLSSDNMKYRSNQALYDSVNVETGGPKCGGAGGKINLGYYYNDQPSPNESKYRLSTIVASGGNKSPNDTATEEFGFEVGTSSKVTRF